MEEDIQETNVAGVDAIISGWKLPAKVANFLSNIKYSKEVIYQTFNFALLVDDAKLQEFVASASKNGDKVNIAYLKAESTGTPIT